MEDFKLTNEQLDALKEIGTVGGGSAATALSQLLNKRVTIEVPRVQLLNSEELSAFQFNIKPDDLTIAVMLNILGAFRGGILVLFSQSSALQMIDILMQREMGNTAFINVMELSAISESAHILCASYLNAVGEFLDYHQLIPSLPKTVIDRLDHMDKNMINKFMGNEAHYLLPIENKLLIEDIRLNLYVVFFLEHASVRQILTSLGI